MKGIIAIASAALLTGCAGEFSTTELMEAVRTNMLDEYVHGLLVGFVVANPTASSAIAVFTLGMPVLTWLANGTKNPIDNAALIALNKALQLATGNTSKNQPDVLSLWQMITNNPLRWAELLRNQMADEGLSVHKRAIAASFKSSLSNQHLKKEFSGSFQQ